MRNRRNYYRLLHVQPDAPAAVIKSSFNAVMLKLKQHPDLGGDHETAALLIEAHDVLTDPVKRAEYDRYLQCRQPKATVGLGPLHRPAPPRPTEAAPPPASPVTGPRAPQVADSTCAFCYAPCLSERLPGTRCSSCGSPLALPITARCDGGDQRAMPRIAPGGEVTVTTQDGLHRSQAVVHDLSTTGMGLLAARPLAVDEVIKIESGILTAIARVVTCRPEARPGPMRALIGVEFLALEFAHTRGTFVSART